MISSDIQIIQSPDILFAKTLQYFELANINVEVVKDKNYTSIVVRMNEIDCNYGNKLA